MHIAVVIVLLSVFVIPIASASTAPRTCELPAFYDPHTRACDCPTGYKLRPDLNTCADVNECVAHTPHVCAHDMCVNTPGGYRCISVKDTESYCFNREFFPGEQVDWLQQWFTRISQSTWRMKWLSQLNELMFTCPAKLAHWIHACARHNASDHIFFEAYHNASCWPSMTPPSLNDYTYGFATNPAQQRHACDANTDTFFDRLTGDEAKHIPLMAEYAAIVPLAFSNAWFYPSKHPGMGVGSYKTQKFLKPCDGLERFHWEELPPRYMLQWNSWLTDDLKAQALEPHTGTPGMYAILEMFHEKVFNLRVPKIMGPNSCCSHFYADSETWYRLGKVQVLSLMYFDTEYHDLQSDGYCPYVTYPIGQDRRCWAFAMERVTDIYAFLSGARRVVNARSCRPEAPNLPRELLFPDAVIDMVWDALMCHVRGAYLVK